MNPDTPAPVATPAAPAATVTTPPPAAAAPPQAATPGIPTGPAAAPAPAPTGLTSATSAAGAPTPPASTEAAASMPGGTPTPAAPTDAPASTGMADSAGTVATPTSPADPAAAAPVDPDAAPAALATDPSAAATAQDAATAAAQAAAGGPGIPADQAVQAAADHSILGLILQAGPIVQGVMGALVLASIICWTIMIEKGFLLAGLQREIKRLGVTGEGDAVNGEGLAARIQRAAAREWAEGRDGGESRAEYRERIERAMRETLTTSLRRAQHGTAFLATTGAVGPFVGLFGTVWGIMGSFQGIAQMHDTSLAVVAPGIAEALLATAIGLFAAIPAVIGYNRIARRVAGLRAEGLAAISAIGARLSARPPRGGHMARAAE